MRPCIVTSYPNPDLDGIACAYAYAEFLNRDEKTASMYVTGTPHPEARYVLDRFSIILPANTDPSGSDIILVDTSFAKHVPADLSADDVIEVIDHRAFSGNLEFAHAKAQVELVGAAATLIAERFFEKEWKPSRESSILLYGAIVSNTLNFQAVITTERDRVAAQKLQELIHLPGTFPEEMFAAKSDLSGDKLRETIEGDFVSLTLHDHKIGIAQIEMVGGSQLITARAPEILDILHNLEAALELEFVFLSLIELKEGENIFVADHEKTQSLLENILGLVFENSLSTRPGLILRKEIIPLLSAVLSSSTID